MNWLWPIKFAGEARGIFVIPAFLVVLAVNMAFWFLLALVLAWGAHTGYNLAN